MKPYRSLLFIPGNRERMLAKGPTTGADALLVDLEDAVPVESKEEARSIAGEYVRDVGDRDALVRINSVESGEARLDLEAVVRAGLACLVLPKVESVETVREVSAWLDELEGARGLEPGGLELVCMIETALGIIRAYAIATASERVASLCFSGGQNGDLQTNLGSGWSPAGTEMLVARSNMLLSARAAGLELPLDGAYSEIDDIEGLVLDSEFSMRLGYKGRAVIHPKHVEHVNRIYTPTPEVLEYCRGLLDALDAALAEGKASAVYDGKMIDYATAEWARRILRRAELLELAHSA